MHTDRGMLACSNGTTAGLLYHLNNVLLFLSEPNNDLHRDIKSYLRSNNPLRFGRLEALTISPQDLSPSHSGAGLGWGFSRATPPVNRKRHTSSSTRSLMGKVTNVRITHIHGITNVRITHIHRITRTMKFTIEH